MITKTQKGCFCRVKFAQWRIDSVGMVSFVDVKCGVGGIGKVCGLVGLCGVVDVCEVGGIGGGAVFGVLGVGGVGVVDRVGGWVL